MDIKANDVKTLREKTGAGMMDCKKALQEAEGDFLAAEKILRQWGLSGIEKRSGRPTNEGRIFCSATPQRAAFAEISCETDFVAKNNDFITAGQTLVGIVAEKEYTSPQQDLFDILTPLAAVIKENITLKRVLFYKAQPGEYIQTYVHGPGSLAVYLKVKTARQETFANETIKMLINDLALHIAAFTPLYLDASIPSPEWMAEQKEIFLQQVQNDEKLNDKDVKVKQGIVEGKMKKLMADICLLEQPFIKDESISTMKYMAKVQKETGSQIEIIDYKKIKVGEN